MSESRVVDPIDVPSEVDSGGTPSPEEPFREMALSDDESKFYRIDFDSTDFVDSLRPYLFRHRKNVIERVELVERDVKDSRLLRHPTFYVVVEREGGVQGLVIAIRWPVVSAQCEIVSDLIDLIADTTRWPSTFPREIYWVFEECEMTVRVVATRSQISKVSA